MQGGGALWFVSQAQREANNNQMSVSGTRSAFERQAIQRLAFQEQCVIYLDGDCVLRMRVCGEEAKGVAGPKLFLCVAIVDYDNERPFVFLSFNTLGRGGGGGKYFLLVEEWD